MNRMKPTIRMFSALKRNLQKKEIQFGNPPWFSPNSRGLQFFSQFQLISVTFSQFQSLSIIFNHFQ